MIKLGTKHEKTLETVLFDVNRTMDDVFYRVIESIRFPKEPTKREIERMIIDAIPIIYSELLIEWSARHSKEIK